VAPGSSGAVAAYLAALPPDRRATVAAVRDVVNRHLPAGFVEGTGYGMFTWSVPLARFPHTYNRQPLGVAALAAHKGRCSLYLMGVYGDPALERWFRAAFAAAGKKLDMGKSCVRFAVADELPLDVIGPTIAKVSPEALIAQHDAAHGKAAKAGRAAARAKAKPAAATKQPAAATKKSATTKRSAR
jgi:hypothetical protein